MQSMETIVNYFAKDMRAHGIPVRKIRKVRVNNSVSYYGCCRLYRKDDTIADITISNMTVANGGESIKNTIIHELVHASLPIDISIHAPRVGNIMVNNFRSLLKRYQRYIIQILNNMAIEQKKLKNSRNNNTNIK